jgi:hypothetical protein
LGRKAIAVINGMEIDDWNLKSVEYRAAAVQRIQEQNNDVEELKSMEIIWIDWRPQRFAKDQKYASIVVEVSTLEMANTILDLSLMMGEEVRPGSNITRHAGLCSALNAITMGTLRFNANEKRDAATALDFTLLSPKPGWQASNLDAACAEEATNHGRKISWKTEKRYSAY